MSKQKQVFNQKKAFSMKKAMSKRGLALAVIGLTCFQSFAGATGIDAGTSELTTYIDPIGNMVIIIGAIVGLVGGIRVFIKWNNGDQDTNKAIMSWFGSCIFLVLTGVIIRAFFGL
jgi:hypothetical protein